MATAHLKDRGVVRVSGADAKAFLDGLVTCDIDRVSPESPRLGALLSPQGKILFDFIVFQAPEEDGGGYYLDTLRAFAPDLVRRLTLYKLRAKVALDDLSEGLGLVVGWRSAPRPPDEAGLSGADPRLKALGWRAIVAAEDVGEFASGRAEDYHAYRIALGVPEAGKDFLLTEAFPHEALMDQLHGVDFDKGCYVGQEVVSRMQHRGTARTRVVPLLYPEGFAPEAGTDVTAGERPLGRTGTGASGRGLAMIRLDRAADALGEGLEIRAGGLPALLQRPDWITFPFPGEERPAAG